MSQKPMTPHYSGDGSRKFWKRVHALPEDQIGKAYALGVLLQNVENDVLRMIANCESARPEPEHADD